VYVNKKISKSTEQLGFKGNVWEAEFVMQPALNGETGIQLAVGNGLGLTISYNPFNKQVTIDRSNTPDYFSAAFADRPTSTATVRLINNELKWHIFFDKSIVEVFINNGEQVFTVQIFPTEENNAINLFSTGEGAVFKRITFWPIKSIW
jgi:fructan beta-fructosidase